MQIDFASRTDVGRVRARNEDALLERPGRGLFAVADGMGGHAAGDIASRIAVDVLDERTAYEADDVALQLADAIRAAHAAILKAGRADSALKGMGTTLTALRVLEEADSARCVLAHVGDSRAYRWRNGSLDQLTRDQTWVQSQVDAGLLSREQARTHPFSSMLTGALGVGDDDVKVQVLEPECEPGDTFLLCTDGLVARLSTDDLRRVLAAQSGLEDAARALVDEANARGGPDNITVSLVRIPSVE